MDAVGYRINRHRDYEPQSSPISSRSSSCAPIQRYGHFDGTPNWVGGPSWIDEESPMPTTFENEEEMYGWMERERDIKRRQLRHGSHAMQQQPTMITPYPPTVPYNITIAPSVASSSGYEMERSPSALSSVSMERSHSAFSSVSMERSSSAFSERSFSAYSGGVSMERTSSGEKIMNEPAHIPYDHDEASLDDDKAATMTEMTIRHRRHRLEERILRALIQRDDILEDDDIDKLILAADKTFFRGLLKDRVRWEWSHPDENRYRQELVGTTALRLAPNHMGGYETLIILSKPLLRQGSYNQRLLVSTLIHELIHCFLFICCGFKAKQNGGHTNGFHRIAKLIDNWAGLGRLQLTNMEVDLDMFRRNDEQVGGPSRIDHPIYVASNHPRPVEVYGLQQQQQQQHHVHGPMPVRPPSRRMYQAVEDKIGDLGEGDYQRWKYPAEEIVYR